MTTRGASTVLEWRTIGMVAAVPGWRVLLLDDHEPSGYVELDVPGWLVQVETRHLQPTTNHGEVEERRVVPALSTYGPELRFDDDWYVVGVCGPNDPEPSAEDVAAARQVRDAHRTRLLAKAST